MRRVLLMFTRTEFNREVRNFKKTHAKKLKELLNENACCYDVIHGTPTLKMLDDFNAGYFFSRRLNTLFYLNKHLNSH